MHQIQVNERYIEEGILDSYPGDFVIICQFTACLRAIQDLD